MRKSALFIPMLLVLVCPELWAQKYDCTHTATSLRCVKFISNYDADTLTFDIQGVHPLLGARAKIRVFGVDAPELRTKNECEKDKARYGKQVVAKFLKSAQVIHLENVARGKYFRILAQVIVDGKSLSDFLLEQGLATAYLGGKKPEVDWCQSYETLARMNAENNAENLE